MEAATRLEAATTGARYVKCNTVISIPSAFEGGVVSGGVPGEKGYVRYSTRL